MNGTLGARSISTIDFSSLETAQEKLRFLLAYAVLAPSSHNSQPWRFRLCADHIELIADRSRALPILDPQDRELIISCGAALGHLEIALRRFGYCGDIQSFPDPSDRDLLACIRLGKPHLPDARDERLFESLFARHTNRKAFRPERISTEFLAKLESPALRQEVWLKIVGDGECRASLADLIAHADRDQIADCRFRRELAHWIHPVTGQYPQPEDGIPCEALGMPGLIANVGPFLVRTFDTGALFAARDRQLAINSPLLVVLGTEEDTPAVWLKTGQALSDLLLSATAEGIAASFLNAPIEVVALRLQVGKILGQEGYSQMILRLGYGEATDPTPRRPLENVIEHKETGACL